MNTNDMTERAGVMTRTWVLEMMVLTVLWSGVGVEAASARDYLKKSDAWFKSEEGRKAAENILSWQTERGDWPKNKDTAAKRYDGDRAKLRGTFDNGATLGELRFLARLFRLSEEDRYRQVFLKGVDHILKAQYANGGWPQYAPPGSGYARHITFNDGTMTGLMSFLHEVATKDEYQFVDEARRTAAKAAFDRGVACILKCQISVDSKLTAWCAQHDEKTFEPRSARSYELVSISGGESASILHLLMSLDQPSDEVKRAVHAGAVWYESAKITGIRQVSVDGDRRIVSDLNAPALWARFYEIGTNRPIFCGRDGVKKYQLSEIERERRTGYAWYNSSGAGVAKAYAKWKERWGEPAQQESRR